MTVEPEKSGPVDPALQPLLAHAIEFRRRLMISLAAIAAGTVFCYIFASDIYAFLVRPLAEAMGAEAMGGENRRLIYTGLTEAFVTYLRLALWSGTLLAFPVMAAQVWFFVAPGLYRRERRAFLPYLIATPALFLAGASMAYYLVFPAAWRFFLSFEMPAAAGGLPIRMEARVSEYLSLSMTLIFAFGLSFQLPVLLVLLTRAGLLTAHQLADFRRFAIVLIFVFAAVMTPPDVLSQISLAVPLMILYEGSIWGAKWAEKQRGQAREKGVKSPS